MDIFRELNEIGQLINNASRLNAIRKAVSKAKQEGIIVTDGQHHPGAKTYDVVVRCSADEDGIARRIRADIPDVDVTRIAKNVLGVSTARRGGK